MSAFAFSRQSGTKCEIIFDGYHSLSSAEH
jgi:hypothetical protein